MIYNQIYFSFLPSLCCFIYVAQLVVVDFINLAQGINMWLWMKLVEEKCPKMQRGWDSPYWQVNLTELHGCSQHLWVRNGQFMVTSIAVARKSAFHVCACSLSLSFYKEIQRGPDNICTCNALYSRKGIWGFYNEQKACLPFAPEDILYRSSKTVHYYKHSWKEWTLEIRDIVLNSDPPHMGGIWCSHLDIPEEVLLRYMWISIFTKSVLPP